MEYKLFENVSMTNVHILWEGMALMMIMMIPFERFPTCQIKACVIKLYRAFYSSHLYKIIYDNHFNHIFFKHLLQIVHCCKSHIALLRWSVMFCSVFLVQPCLLFTSFSSDSWFLSGFILQIVIVQNHAQILRNDEEKGWFDLCVSQS